MRVLITGATGQLGHALQKTHTVFSNQCDLELIALSRAEMDLAKPETIEEVLGTFSPNAVINAAAYTAVDKAETEQELASVINTDAVTQIARWCEKNAAILIQVSTDFVFDGKKSSAYDVTDQPNPIGIYGKTKHSGERAALEECVSSYVVRTGWVYGEHGANFAKTILRLANERDQLGIVADQIGTPTYAKNLAETLWVLLLAKPEQRLWHFSDAGVASWYDFAVAITEEANQIGLLNRKPSIKPISTQEYPTPAVRPSFSVLNKKSTWDGLNLTPKHWRQALKEMLQELYSIQQSN